MLIVIDTSVVVAGLRSQQGVAIDRCRGLGLPQIDVFLAALASACTGVETHYQWRPQLRDSADEMVLECVVNGAAD